MWRAPPSRLWSQGVVVLPERLGAWGASASGSLAGGEHPNAGVSRIAAQATGSYLTLLDVGTALAAEALAWFPVAIERTGAAIIYADHDTVACDALGRERLAPLLKPALDRALLPQRNYVGQTFGIMQRSYLERDGP
jgi:hypothetical protein